MKLIDAEQCPCYKLRLIDAEAFYDQVLMMSLFDNQDRDIFLDAIDAQPTAYDVDSVVEELNYIEMKWGKSCPPHNECGEPMCDVDCVECQIRRCKDIVRRGGVDE